jgi:hypothetical protein
MTRLRSQDGFAVATALSLLSIMLFIGVATLAAADTGSERAREQRVRESALNLTEGVLYSQGAVLARKWPTTQDATVRYPAFCNPASAGTEKCPSKDTLSAANSSQPAAAAFASTDFLTDGTWETFVRDNYGALAGVYQPGQADGTLTGANGTCPVTPCTFDFNDDKALWVQARSRVRDRTRNVVALLKLEELTEAVPQRAVVSGALRVTNNGNHGGTPMLNADGSNVTVRCVPEPAGTRNATCMDYEPGQVTPLPVQGNPPPTMSPDQILRFRERAMIDRTYYTGCPPDNLVGEVVFVEQCYNPGQYNGSGAVPCTPPNPALKPSCVNTIEKPGVLIVRCGGLQTASNWTYVGLMYFVNGSDGSCAPRGNNTCTGNSFDPGKDVLESKGGFGIWGALMVDGPACVKLGSNGMQVKFDANVFNAARSYGTVGLVQNTWRELPAS